MATAQLDTLLRHIRKLAARGCTLQRSDPQLLDDFSTSRDEAAFSTLVARHGPMVLRVCRRVLNHEQDAEDSFQATFLVLAQNTGSIRKPEALAEWLHGVAYRTAMEAKRKAARRRNHETRVRTLLPKTVASPTWDDVQAILDEEIQRLPAAFRAAFVLCALEGKSGAEAAAELGIQLGTVSSRLTRARQRLQQRLARRGVELSALLAALAVAENAGKAGVPALLASATVRSGLLVAAGGTAAGIVPAHVATLAAGVTKAMFLTKAKIITTIMLTASLLAGGAGVLTHQALAGKPVAAQASETKLPRQELNQLAAKEEASKTDAVAIKEEAQDTITYSGRVLGPDGQPVAGAKLFLTQATSYLNGPSPSSECATARPDGRFQFTVPKTTFRDRSTIVAATAANHGPGWVEVLADGERSDLTLQLADDDVPITGLIVDLEGKPVSGATLRVLQINAAPREDLGPWLEAVKDKNGQSFDLEQQYLKRYTTALSPQVTTDAEGHFQLTGIGRNRLVIALLEGPAIASQDLHILTRPGKTIEVPDRGRPANPRWVTTYYGASFRHVAAPARLVAGVVRDKDTKKPLAGVTIQSLLRPNSPPDGVYILQTTTDEQGRYRLTGMPKGERQEIKGKGSEIRVVPPGDLPYLMVTAPVPDGPGLDPMRVDVELKRGVWIEGKITDKVTGKPLPADVKYIPLDSDENLRDYPGFVHSPLVAVKEDGCYRIVGMAGPGLVAVFAPNNLYLRVSERQDEYGIKEFLAVAYRDRGLPGSNCGAIARIDPAKGSDSVKRDVTLDPGTVRMELGAAVTGRLVDADGKPRAGALLQVTVRRNAVSGWRDYSPGPIKTDRRGRFCIGELLPGYEFRLKYEKGELYLGGAPPSGQTKDLGDVQLKPQE